MKKINLLLLLLIGFGSFAQCPVGDVTLNTQADVDNFQINYPNCSVIDGNLAIFGSDIYDLSPLINITVVNGNISINSNSTLTSISGLQNITSCNQINISLNPLLQDLDGLQSLQNITGHLVIIYNDGLQNINHLSNLTSFSGASIYNNAQLSSLNGLQGITAAPGYLNIQNNNLTDLTGLNNLSTAGSMYIADNPGLTSFTGLENLTDVSGTMLIDNHPILADLSALNHTINFGSLQITQNPNLTSCAVQSVCDFVNVSNASISNNGVNCNSQSEVINQCNMNVTQLKTNHCGEQLSTFGEVFWADNVPGATEYKFEIKNIGDPNDVTYNDRHIASNTLYLAGHMHVDETYLVRIKVKINGEWGIWGPACELHSPNEVPLTSLNNTWCNASTNTFADVFHAYTVTGATNYMFEFKEIGSTDPPIENLRIPKTNTLQIPGLLTAGVTYEVRVKAFIGTQEGDYGPVCLLDAPAQVPLTKIRDADCGITLSSYHQVFKCDQVAGATAYRFKFNGTIVSDRPTFTNTLYIAGLLTQNTQHAVEVAAKVGGVWGAYGDVCYITSPPTPPMNLPGQDDNTIGELTEGSAFTAGITDEETPSFAVYPNPAIEAFSLKTDLDNYTIKLYSTNGQLVYNASQLSGTQQIEVSQFDAGLYILQISDSENVLLETTKITVMK